MSIKEFFKKLRELWKIPKFKGLIQIAFWIIFFLLISLMFRSADKAKQEEIEIKKQQEVVASYNYNYQYNDYVNIIDISGTNYLDKEVFNLNNNKYYYVDTKYYNALDKSIVEATYPFNEWRYSAIKNIIDNNKYSNLLEYTDESVYEYNIDYNVYNSYYNTNYVNNILLTVTVKDDFIKEVVINYTTSTVKIEYSNINEIKKMDINID